MRLSAVTARDFDVEKSRHCGLFESLGERHRIYRRGGSALRVASLIFDRRAAFGRIRSQSTSRIFWRVPIPVMNIGGKNPLRTATSTIANPTPVIRFLPNGRKRVGYKPSSHRTSTGFTRTPVAIKCWSYMARHAKSCALGATHGFAPTK